MQPQNCCGYSCIYIKSFRVLRAFLKYFLLMMALIVQPLSMAKAEDDSSIPRSMSLTTSYRYVLESLNAESEQETIENIHKLKANHYEETMAELFKLVQWELEKAAEGKKEEMRLRVVGEALTALIEVSTHGNINYIDLLDQGDVKEKITERKIPMLERLEIAHEELVRSYAHSPFYQNLEEKFMILEKSILGILKEVPVSVFDVLYRDNDIQKHEVPALESSIPTPKAKFYRAEADANDPEKINEKEESRLKRIQSDLEAQIIEQPEVVKALVKLERRNFRYTRLKPEHLMFMGLPGGGKDTIANAYAKVISGNSPNWRDHIHSLPIVKEKSDLWQVGGSATGYIGSDKFPELFDFLIKYSGGRYLKKERTDEREKVEYYIEENKEWAPGKILPGVRQPSEGIMFVNEFHNWSRETKDLFMKQAVERGIFFVNNPNGGVSKIEVPITILLASNDGTTAISSRELSGERFGKPLTYEQMLKKWEGIHNDRSYLRDLLKRTRGGRNEAPRGNMEGTSEEMANRIQRIFLLRPISPDGLIKIARMKLNSLKDLMKDIRAFGSIELEWTDRVERFVQQYQYEAEENARPIGDKVEQLIQETIDDAIGEKRLRPTRNGQKVVIDVAPNGDGTYNLKFEATPNGKPEEAYKAEILIEGTLETKDPEPLSEEERQKLKTLADRMMKKVFGVDAVAEKVAKAVLVSEKERKVNLNRKDGDLPKARRFMFLGLTGTGKTEMAKVLAEELYGSRDKVAVLDFSTVSSKHEFNQMFTGEKESPVASEFMKEYDKNGGELIVVLDEIANAPREVLKALYPFLDEGEVKIFNDGKARKMSNVTFIATGNAGEEWYQGIPEQVPEMERRNSMEDIYKRAMRNARSQEVLLQKFFSEALIGRFGIHNIMFFPPHSFKSVRQLIMLKFKQAIKMIGPLPGKPGWNLKFSNEAELEKVLDAIEKEGFIISEQGRSIDNYVKDIMRIEIDALLENKDIPYGSDVLVTLDEDKFKSAKKEDKGLYLTLQTQGQSYPLFIRGKEYEEKDVVHKVDQTLTAYHEVGHELLRHIFFSDKSKPEQVRIIPGVDWFGTRWIYYAGVARSEEIERKVFTRDLVLREMAIFAGGYVAQQLVTKGAVDDAGKRNDMERATELANNAIFRWQLAPHVTRTAIAPNVDMIQHIQSLDAETLKAYRKEVEAMMFEAETLARRALLMNYETAFIPMGKWLAIKGEIKAEQFEKFYTMHGTVSEVENPEEFRAYYEEIGRGDYFRDERGNPHFFSEMELVERLKAKAKKLLNRNKPASQFNNKPARDAQFIHPDLLPNEVADIAGIIEEKQRVERAEAGLFEFNYIEKTTSERGGNAVKGGSCRDLFAF